MTVRRYRAGSEVEKLRKENLELKAKLQALAHSAEPGDGVPEAKGRRGNRAVESGDALMTPPALPRIGGKIMASGARYVLCLMASLAAKRSVEQ